MICIFSCAPDWHSNQRTTSYVIWILLFGFLFPSIVIAIASMATCLNIRQVIHKKIYIYKLVVTALDIVVKRTVPYY